MCLSYHVKKQISSGQHFTLNVNFRLQMQSLYLYVDDFINKYEMHAKLEIGQFKYFGVH